MNRNKMKLIGRLWQRKVRGKESGEDYLIGHIVNDFGNKHEIVVFFNKKKSIPTHADWNIFLQNAGMNHKDDEINEG